MLRDLAAWLDILPYPRGVSELLIGLASGAGAFVAFARALRRQRVDLAEVPLLAEGLLGIFARGKDIEALKGDFEELFARDCEAGISLRRAKARYWARVLRSIGPQIVQCSSDSACSD